ncbi:Ig-like domain-containing protein [bacterium]|nr:Ig-like domain-containing protein [candidate division CSSED10-310 bacterium]
MGWTAFDALRRRGSFPLTAGMTALCVFNLVLLSACVSTRITPFRIPMEDHTSAHVSIFLKERDARQGGPVVNGVLAELYYHDGQRWQLVQRESIGQWTAEDLVPGRYRVAVKYRLDADGRKEALSGDTEQFFTLRSGEAADIRIVVEKTPVIAIIFLTLTVFFLVVFLVHLMADEDADCCMFPSPVDMMVASYYFPPLVITPAPAEWQMGVVAPPYVEDWDGRWRYPADQRTWNEPQIIHHGPHDGSGMVSRESDILIQFSDPMDTERLDHRYIVVTDGDGRRISGGIYYLEESRTCMYDPLRPLPPGETITVSVYGEEVLTRDGRPLGDNYQWSFTTIE